MLVDSGAETCIIGGEANRHLGLSQGPLPLFPPEHLMVTVWLLLLIRPSQ